MFNDTKDEERKGQKSETAKREEAILKFWQDNKIFEKSENRGEKQFVFYDGPPFATGLPHYGHLLQSAIKDAIPRFKVMQGYRLRRRWGWDCHGLPLENEIEKELGISGKKEIEEKFGILKFNQEAKKRVLRYADDWQKIINRLGRFVDMKNDYRTMDASYTESVWWAFKTLYEKGLAYNGFKSMHLCPRCGTTLSNFEVNLGYKEITDISVYVKFELIDEPGTYLLAWTTTPWTLPGNFALAVKPEVDYLKIVNEKKEFLILAEERFEALKDKFEKLEMVGKISGQDLIGKKYQPIFDYYKEAEIENKENAWQIYGADFVTTEEGTGIVHIAPAFGEEDLQLAKEKNIPIVHHIGEDGRFKKEVRDFAGLLAKPKADKSDNKGHQETDILIIKDLAKRGVLWAKEKINHSYPHCWRCDTPLMNYAHSSWFIKVTDIKDKLVKENEKVLWVPESVGKYRFGNWLAEARDWAISRARFWGAPIPVWQSADGKEQIVLGSLHDFRKQVKKSGNQYLVMRHGQAENNVGNFLSSKKNDRANLTEEGKKQIGQAGQKLKNDKPDLIFSSDLIRTKETALSLAQKIDFPEQEIIFDERIREINTGDFAGQPNSTYHAFYNSYEEAFVKKPPNGESLSDVRRRAMEFLYELEEKYQNKKILIITHEYVFWMMWSGAHGLTNRQSAEAKEEKSEFIETGEILELPFVPLPHNEDFELDFHRPFIDEIEVLSSGGEKLKRISDVFDCWFESGSMPYAQDHYPFEKKDFAPEKKVGYPADFVGEAMDQTRGWFYSLIVLGVELFGQAPYKNVICTGLILAEDGQKMSKRLKNYPEVDHLFDRYGADALRYYLLSSPVVRGEEFNFSEKGVDEVVKKHLNRLLNVGTFLETYAGDLAEITFADLRALAQKSPHLLDQWILARLAETIKEVTAGLEQYELDRATRPMASFIDDLSTWYLRRSRDRFKDEAGEDRVSAIATTRVVLLEFSKLIAPIMPFVAEFLFLKLKTKEASESVHFQNWPAENDWAENFSPEILKLMTKTRELAELGLSLRELHKIKIRQPLQKIIFSGEPLPSEAILILAEELNIKEIVFDQNLKESAVLTTEISPELKIEGEKREITRAIRGGRKEAKLSPQDEIVLTATPNLAKFLLANKNLWPSLAIKELKEETNFPEKESPGSKVFSVNFSETEEFFKIKSFSEK